MSLHRDEIPIRPRYGLPELEDDAQEPDGEEEESSDAKETSRAIRTRKSSNSDQQISSYSEIPFLAQYPDAVPENVLRAQQQQKMLPVNDSLEEEDDSENSNRSSSDKKRPDSLQCDSTVPYELEGATTSDGEMRHFVAANLEEKLRSASPLNKKDQFSGFASQSSTPSTSAGAGLLTRHFLQTQMPQIDANVLNDIEIEAQYLAASVDNLVENLCNLLHSISSITADNVEVHKNAVNKLTDCMDGNIKCMYTIMAKTEEISKSMKPSEQLGQRIREIKRLVDMLENTM